jgi:hypothetical protein
MNLFKWIKLLWVLRRIKKMHPPADGWKKLTLTATGSALIAVVMLVGPAVGLSHDTAQYIATAIGTLFGVSIAAFGLQDFGKAKAKIENGK